jgi:predicted amidohydrolase YtcJ
VVGDHHLPELSLLIGQITASHAERRRVAVHCVSGVALALTLAALDEAGPLDGDRVEHCAEADADAVRELAVRRLHVVTQPALVARRGDALLDRVPSAEHRDLWRYGSLLRAGVPTAPGSDAPYGDPDPWACLRAARDRTAPSGRVLGPDERVPPTEVLRGLLSRPCDPGGVPRHLAPRVQADLVLLHVPIEEALRVPDASLVRATFVAGRVVHGVQEIY